MYLTFRYFIWIIFGHSCHVKYHMYYHTLSQLPQLPHFVIVLWSYHISIGSYLVIFAIFCYVPDLYLMYLVYLMYLNLRYMIEHLFVLVVFSPFFAIFLISTLILPYFCKNPDHFVDGTPNQGLLNDSTDDYCITLSLFGHFHPLIFGTFCPKYLFMDPGTLLDGTPNLE